MTVRFKKRIEGLGTKAPKSVRRILALVTAAMLASIVMLLLVKPLWAQTTAPISFGKSLLMNASSVNPTSLQFGPDGRLYVAQQDGLIKAYTVERNGANDYSVTATETINLDPERSRTTTTTARSTVASPAGWSPASWSPARRPTR